MTLRPGHHLIVTGFQFPFGRPSLESGLWFMSARNRRARICVPTETGEGMARWTAGEQTVQFLVDRNRLESFEAEDLAVLTEALVARAMLRVETTATAALAGGDVDGAYVAAYDAYRMAAEALLARQALRATGGDGRTWPLKMPCQLSSERKFRPSRSLRLSDSAVPVIQRSTLTRPRRRSPRPMLGGHREGEGGSGGSEGIAGSIAAGAVRLFIWQRKPEQGSVCDRVVEGAGS